MAGHSEMVERAVLVKWTAQDIETALDLNAKGHTTAFIGKKLGRSGESVRSKLRQMGALYSLPPPKKKNVEWPLNCFAGQDVKIRETTPRMLQAPVNHTAGGVGPYG